jgi:hypothetical protein
MMKDKIEQAKKVVKSVTEFNKLPFPTRTMDELQLQIEVISRLKNGVVKSS